MNARSGTEDDPPLQAIFEQLNELIASQVEIKNAISAGQDQQVADKTNWRKAKRYKRGYKHRQRTIKKLNRCHKGNHTAFERKIIHVLDIY
jgi:hypothetical protein